MDDTEGGAAQIVVEAAAVGGVSVQMNAVSFHFVQVAYFPGILIPPHNHTLIIPIDKNDGIRQIIMVVNVLLNRHIHRGIRLI